MTSGLSPRFAIQFVRAVGVLAMSAEDQLSYLSSLGVPGGVDELALEFDDTFLLAKQFVQLGWIDSETYEQAHSLDAELSAISGSDHAELWTATALTASPQWASIRLRARALLFSL